MKNTHLLLGASAAVLAAVLVYSARKMKQNAKEFDTVDWLYGFDYTYEKE